MMVDWSRVGHGSGMHNRSGVHNGRGVHKGTCGVGQRGGDFGNFSNVGEGLLVHDSIETVVGVGGVVDGALGAIGVNDGVGALNDVAIAGLVLSLRVTS